MAWPTDLDNLRTNHVANEVVTSAEANSINGAINRLEAELGLDPSGTLFSTVRARLDALPASVANAALLNAANTFTAFPQTFGTGDKPYFGHDVPPTRIDIREGTAGSPITALGNTLRASKTTAMTRATFLAGGTGGQTTDDDAAVAGASFGTSGSQMQVNGVAGYARNEGTSNGGSGGGPDALGVYGGGVVGGSGIGRALGGYFFGRSTATNGQISGVEIQSQNQTGSDDSYSATGTNPTVGLLVSAGATGVNNISACGIRFKGDTVTQFDVGIGFGSEGPIVSSSFRDDGTATNSIYIVGTQTTGIRIEGTHTTGIRIDGTMGVGLNIISTGSTAINLQPDAGPVALSNNYVGMTERTAPSAPATANSLRFFARDSGAGKTQLVVRFTSGNDVVIAEDF